MTFKERKIEKMAKELGVASGYSCSQEERCPDCILFGTCFCYRHAKMAIELGYEKKEEIERETAKTILSRLKSQMYYPDLPADSRLVVQKVVDEDDVEKEIGILVGAK